MHRGWKNGGFRGFADYMETPAFAAALEALLALAARERVASMCAEALPWRCHRTLIADAALARGVAAEHILGDQSVRPHALTSFARIVGGCVTYPEIDPPLPGLEEFLDRRAAGHD